MLLRFFTGEIVVVALLVVSPDGRSSLHGQTTTVFPGNEIRDEAKSQKNGPLGMMRIIRVRMLGATIF